jgi:hypothetical protein
MASTIPIKVSEKTHSDLFELKCAWRLKSFDETIQKLIKKVGNSDLPDQFSQEKKP